MRSSVSTFRPDTLFILAGLMLASFLPVPSCKKHERVAERSTHEAEAGNGLVELAKASGVDFVHETGGRGELHMPEIMGAGVAMLDYDRDGRLDLYFLNGNEHIPEAKVSTRHVNRLYRQRSTGEFEDATADAGLGDGGYGMGVAVGDVNNDGWPDVYVANYGRDRLYINRQGRFVDVTSQSNVRVDGWSCSVAMMDIDRDGWLDIYVTRYLQYDPAKKCTDRAGRPNYCSPQAFLPEHDVLLRNVGEGTFNDVSQQTGVRNVRPAAALGVVCADFNDDGFVDLFVANDGYPNYLLVNDAGRRFSERSMELGVAYNRQGMAEAGMGVVAADFDLDCDLDLFMTHLANESNTFYQRLEPGAGFEDATNAAGLAQSSLRWTGFGVAAIDLEHDGDLDVLVGNGRVSRNPNYAESTISPWDEYAEPNLAYLNRDGRFASACENLPAFCNPRGITRGLATGDIDGDGDTDVVVSETNAPARLFRNDLGGGRWLRVLPIDPRYGRPAIGAEVEVVLAGRCLRRVVSRSGSYLSSRAPALEFGLGQTAEIHKMSVFWPDGLAEAFSITPDQYGRQISLFRGEGTKIERANPKTR